MAIRLVAVKVALMVALFPFASLAMEGSPFNYDAARAKEIRSLDGHYTAEQIDFMVRTIFSYAPNQDIWSHRWARKRKTPEVARITILDFSNGYRPLSYTSIKLKEEAQSYIVVMAGSEGNPRERVWITLPALREYFMKVTAEDGKLLQIGSGFFSAIFEGLRIKSMLKRHKVQGLSWKEKDIGLSPREERENLLLREFFTRSYRRTGSFREEVLQRERMVYCSRQLDAPRTEESQMRYSVCKNVLSKKI
ncbi:MAG: hypothetical protein ACE5LX_01920 [Nitrospinota bacterium]